MSRISEEKVYFRHIRSSVISDGVEVSRCRGVEVLRCRGKTFNIGVAVSYTAKPRCNWSTELIVSLWGSCQLLAQHAIATWTSSPTPPLLSRQNICPRPQCRILAARANIATNIELKPKWNYFYTGEVSECNFIRIMLLKKEKPPVSGVACLFDTRDIFGALAK